MDLGTIDRWSIYGDSQLHRASALAKLVAAGLLLAAIILSQDLFVLIAIYLAVAAAAVLARLPLLKVLTLAAYPAVFALLIAASRWHGSLLDPMVILVKTMTAAATMVLLIATTPYPQLFGVLHHLLPGLVVDALFLTYRSLFILLGLLGDLFTALRLRGGLTRRRYVRNARNTATGLGLLVVRAVSLAEQFYLVLKLRGYSGKLSTGVPWRSLSRIDLLPLFAALVVLGVALWFRLVPDAEQYNGYPLVAGLLALLAALLTRHTSSPRTG